ncbi:MAG: biopolymer transporter ExbD [Chlamydiae bacterium]|nr:biopolymer transporter ExbD [Chlamydiota bacterium]
MSLIPDEKIKTSPTFNLAPMIDFLFLMLAFFATIAVSRTTLYDTYLKLAQLKTEKNAKPISISSKPYQINISINKDNKYTWISDVQNYPMESLAKIQKELLYQYNVGILPKDKSLTHVLLHIDKTASWEAISKLIFAIREDGFEAFPIYESDNT